MTTEIKKYYYETGELSYEAPYKNGERHGIWKGYYITGELSYESPYENGELHGVERVHYETGEVKYTNYYLYGNKVTEEEYRKHELTEQLANI